MDMYTTDAIPDRDAKPIKTAWLVSVSTTGAVEGALHALEQEATRQKADAVVGVRVAVTEICYPDSSGRYTQGHVRYAVYGTAVKLEPAPRPKFAMG
ncbi:heavy metal-binding domain-containing protein [Streptomyces cavernae]|uniref:heavy metal-binding domain-containing protein n=1 Tax=Streptomyces cavernae TaxID=2259034 RepID=UPI000FEC01E4|nr:heavy metal-binding domain-containing protein [Streptomyces cavernae]